MRLPAAARLRSERQAGGYRCAAEEGGPGHRTQWADPATRRPLPLLLVRSPPPSLCASHNSSFHLPAPPISPPPLSPDIPPPQSFLWWRRSRTLAGGSPVPLTPPRFPVVLSLRPGVKSGRGPTGASGVGGVVGRPVPVLRVSA